MSPKHKSCSKWHFILALNVNNIGAVILTNILVPFKTHFNKPNRLTQRGRAIFHPVNSHNNKNRPFKPQFFGPAEIRGVFSAIDLVLWYRGHHLRETISRWPTIRYVPRLIRATFHMCDPFLRVWRTNQATVPPITAIPSGPFPRNPLLLPTQIDPSSISCLKRTHLTLPFRDASIWRRPRDSAKTTC